MLVHQLRALLQSMPSASEYDLVLQELSGPVGYILAGLLGALWGSFANVCIYRMPPSEKFPKGRSVISPPSHCFECGAAVRWYDNVPILAFLWLRGACRDCKATFSPRYLLVEAASAMLFVAAFHFVFGIRHLDQPPARQLVLWAAYAAFLWTLLVITFIDLDHKLILNRVTYKAIPISYAFGLLIPGRTWSEGLVGALVGYGFVRLISDGYKFITGRFGMGYGDGKLLAIVGAFLGWQSTIISIFAGSIVGTVVSVALLARQKKSSSDASPSNSSIRHLEIPFGPFLVVGAITYFFMQDWFRMTFGLLWGDYGY